MNKQQKLKILNECKVAETNMEVYKSIVADILKDEEIPPDEIEGDLNATYGKCPTCGATVNDWDNCRRCSTCGQALYWK